MTQNMKILLAVLALAGIIYYMRQNSAVSNEGELPASITMPQARMGMGASSMNTNIYPASVLADNTGLGPVANVAGGSDTGVHMAKTEIDEWDDHFKEANSVIGRAQVSRNDDRFAPNCEEGDIHANYERNPVYKRNKRKLRREPDGSFDPDMFDPLNLLPQEKYDDWFEVIDEPISLKNRHLVSLQQPQGIDTVGQTLKNATLDLRGAPPNPKMVVSPWNQSTIEPDYNIRPWCN
jgi:hypothetical protein